MDDLQSRELFTLRNSLVIMDEDISKKMYLLKAEHPERGDSTITAYEWSEIGMASLFHVLYDHEVRYCADYKSWYVYQNGKWESDPGAIMISEKVKDFSRIMTLYCGEIADDELREKYTTFIARMGDRRLRNRIMEDIKSEMPIRATEFDSNPYLINCLNGTYDLKTFTFYEHRWSDFITMQTAFEHTVNRDRRCPRWEEFIDEVTQHDTEKADYLQKALGYSLLGIANEECMFLLHGKTTRNGKSTMLNTIETMLGDYAKVAPVGMICKGDRQKDAEAASPTLAGLKGKRFVTMAESSEYGKLDEEKIKQYTGGEQISARALYQAAVTFTPQFTLWLSCNDLPNVHDKSLFASDRLRVVEFNRHFRPEEQDRNLKTELTQPEAMSGIFNWLIVGYLNYVKHGLVLPEHMRTVIKSYEDDNDTLLQFLEDRCQTEDGAITKAKDLYTCFKHWCKSNGMDRIPSARRMNSDMERHDYWYTERKRSNGDKVYVGIRIKTVTM